MEQTLNINSTENKMVALSDSWQPLNEDFLDIEDEISIPEDIF